MANSVGGIIEAVDYNSIRNKIIAVLGTGASNSGYGQDARIQSSSVANGSSVTATQWGNLRYDIYNCLVHQNGTTPSIVRVSTGDPVRYGAGHPNNSYDTFSNTITTNRFNLGSGQFSTASLGTTSWSDTWSVSAYVDVTCTWATANDARYFFNSGGQILFLTSKSTGGTSQSVSWYNVVTSAGTQGFGGQIPTSGFSPQNGTNFYRLTSTFQTYHTTTASSPYAANTYRLQAKSNVANNASGTANIVTFRVLLTDGYRDPDDTAPSGPGQRTPPDDVVSGTFTIAASMILPGGVMQPAPATGNFVVKGPRPADGGSITIGSAVLS